MKKYRTAFPLTFILVFGFTQLLLCQIKISQSVIGGGGVAISGESHQVLGTVGQPLVGLSTNNVFQAHSGFWYGKISSPTGLENIEDLIPIEFKLEQNYPNPFNPSTKIKFGLPKDSKVLLLVYNILGEKVAQPVNQHFHAGYHEVELYNTNLTSGIYFYTIQAGDFVETKKMILLK